MPVLDIRKGSAPSHGASSRILGTHSSRPSYSPSSQRPRAVFERDGTATFGLVVARGFGEHEPRQST